LDFTRLETGKIKIEHIRFNLKSLVDETISIFYPIALSKNLDLSLQYNVSPTMDYRSDPVRIKQVLGNLISNAIKFTNIGGEIIISVEQRRNRLLVTVADNGVGIKTEAMDKLFVIEKSYSTIGTLNEKGTGLGLILCKEFIERHGGEIWVESEVGKGSKFLFTIPENIKNSPHKFDSNPNSKP